MWKFSSIILAFILLQFWPTQCATVVNPSPYDKPLIFVGKYDHYSVIPVNKIDGQGTDQVSISSAIQGTSYYFRSQNAAGWSTGANDCKAYLGENATLLYVETQEELSAVTEFLQSSDDTGSTYWVGGKYEPSASAFVWSNGVELGSWIPWKQGHPDSKLPVTKISAYGAGGITLQTQFQTVSNRYLCELNI